MCGRFASVSRKEIENRFQIVVSEQAFPANYNVAPTSILPIISFENEAFAVRGMKWGLVPSFAQDASVGIKMLNARAESLHEKAAFRGLIASQRCLVPADGFYEFETRGKQKYPIRFLPKNEEMCSLGGLFSIWKQPQKENEWLYTFTIITTEPNELVKPIHDRMPLMFNTLQEKEWLNPERKSYADLADLLQPFPASEMKSYPVSPLLNSVKNNGADLWKLYMREANLFDLGV